MTALSAQELLHTVRPSTEHNGTKLRQAAVELGRGLRTPQGCKKLGVSEAYYRSKQENTQLKKLVADQALDNMTLKEVASGNF